MKKSAMARTTRTTGTTTTAASRDNHKSVAQKSAVLFVCY